MFGDFDEAAYLRANPDVRGLVERGVFRSGFEHWHAVGAKEHALGDRRSGFFEHDLIYDEEAYLRQNPDVTQAVRARAVRNGYQHWIRFGRQEYARGKRLGPFKAPSGLFRPFRVPTPGGALFVSRAPDDFGSADRLEVRAFSAAPLGGAGASVACSKPLRLVDVCGEGVTLRLLVAASPREFDPSAVPFGTRIRVAIYSRDAEYVSTFNDLGVQAFSFLSADDANEFVATARAAGQSTYAPASVVDFALERLTSSPRRPGYEKPLTFRIEDVSRSEGSGLSVGGWVALPPEGLAGFRAWRPECADFFDLTRVWARLSRADIVERFPELRSRGEDRYGFRAVVNFTQPFPSSPGEKVLFGATKQGQPEEWIELDAV